jgi:hypothetical protein
VLEELRVILDRHPQVTLELKDLLDIQDLLHQVMDLTDNSPIIVEKYVQ